MSGPQRGLPLRIAALLGLVLVAIIAGTGYWAATTNTDLVSARTAVAAASSELATTQGTISQTQTDVATAREALKTEQSKITAASEETNSLTQQVARRGQCITAQTANLTELQRILGLERANFARSTSGSAWAKASDAVYAALLAAIKDTINAWTNAAGGRCASANSWLSASNHQISISNTKVKLANAEVKKTNAASDTINAANDAFEQTLTKTDSTCGR